MADETRRYQPMTEEDEPMRLDEVLQPYGQPAPQAEENYAQDEYPQDEYPQEDYPENPYEQEEDYSDYHEELDHESRVKTAMGVFDTISTLVGVVVILALVAMLLSLAGWLRTDIVHSVTLLQSGLQ